jgi:F-type H+-transporting ATPase subunit b
MHESTGILGTLGIDAYKLIAQLVNFAIVVFVMWRWVYRPLVKTMDARSKEITTGLENAKEAKRQLSDATAEKEQLVNDARAEAMSILDETKGKAEAVRQERLKIAKEEIEKIAAEAKERLKMEREAAYGALQNDIADLVRRATEKVAKGFDDKTHRALIAEAMKEIEKV